MQKNYIGGEWVEGVAANRNVNPSNLDDVVGEFSAADAGQAAAAIDAAYAAFPAWAMSSPEVRSDALDRIGAEVLSRKDELGRLLAREEGETLPEAIGEVVRAGRVFKFFAGEALRIAGDHLASVRPGVERNHPRAGGGYWTDHAVEFSDCDSGLENRSGAGVRQLCRVQAGRSRAGLSLGAR